MFIFSNCFACAFFIILSSLVVESTFFYLGQTYSFMLGNYATISLWPRFSHFSEIMFLKFFRLHFIREWVLGMQYLVKAPCVNQNWTKLTLFYFQKPFLACSIITSQLALIKCVLEGGQVHAIVKYMFSQKIKIILQSNF